MQRCVKMVKNTQRVSYLKKHYRMFVTNTDLAVSVFTAIGIDTQVIDSYVHFSIEAHRKNDVIIQLNKGKVIIYDIEEL